MSDPPPRLRHMFEARGSVVTGRRCVPSEPPWPKGWEPEDDDAFMRGLAALERAELDATAERRSHPDEEVGYVPPGYDDDYPGPDPAAFDKLVDDGCELAWVTPSPAVPAP